AGSERRLGDVDSLLDLAFRADRPEVLDAVDAADGRHRAPEASRVVHVALDKLDTLLFQVDRARAGQAAARQGADAQVARDQMADDRAALPAGCANYENGPP